jgi:hypothetical protein
MFCRGCRGKRISPEEEDGHHFEVHSHFYSMATDRAVGGCKLLDPHQCTPPRGMPSLVSYW